MKKGLLALPLLLATVSLGACASDTVDIGVLQLVTATPLNLVETNLEETIKASDWGKKKNLKFNLQNPEANSATMATMATLLAQNSDIVVTIATNSTLAVKNAIEKGDNDIPLVFSAVTDAVASSIITSNAAGRPENITGVSDKGDGTAPFMDEIIDGFADAGIVKKIGLFYNSTESNSIEQITDAKAEITKKGWTYEEKTVTKDSEISTVCNSFTAPIIYYPTDNLLVSNKAIISGIAKEKGLFIATSDPSTAESGDALFSHGVDYADIGVSAGETVADILGNGKSASSIAVKTPAGRLAVNKTAAKDWDLVIPEALVNEADVVL